MAITEDLVAIIVCAIAFIVTCASCFGMYLLSKFTRPYSNQIKIIMSISLTEMSLSVLTMQDQVCIILKIDDSWVAHMQLVTLALYCCWYLMFYLMMVDRLIGSCFPFWYRGEASSKLITRTLLIGWSMTIIAVPVMWLLIRHIKQFRRLFHEFLWLTLDSLFIILFFILYSSIFYIKYRSRKQFGRAANREESKRFLKVTSLMLLSFVLLEAGPTATTSIAYATTNSKRPDDFKLYGKILWQLNLLVDQIIYIFMHPYISSKLARCFLVCVRRVHDNNIELEEKRVQT